MSAATLYISILRGAGIVKRPTTTIIAIIQVFKPLIYLLFN